MIGNVDQVNKDYGLNMTKVEFDNILVPAWLALVDGHTTKPMTDDDFVKWYKASDTNRMIAGALARMWSKCFHTKQELFEAKIKLADLAVDDFLIKQLDQTEKFINNARAVLVILKGVKNAEDEEQRAKAAEGTGKV